MTALILEVRKVKEKVLTLFKENVTYIRVMKISLRKSMKIGMT